MAQLLRQSSDAALASSYTLLPSDKPPAGVSVCEAATSLAKICVGTGVMALPWAFVQGGALAVPGLVLLGAWNYYTSYQLIEARHAFERRGGNCGPMSPGMQRASRSAYSALAYGALGRPGRLLLECGLISVLVGVCASLQMQAAQLAHSLIPAASHTLCVLVTAPLLAPLVLLKTASGLSRVNLAGLIVLIASLSSVCIEGSRRYYERELHATATTAESAESALSALTAMPSLSAAAAYFGVAAFCFGTQALVLPVQESMARPAHARRALGLALSFVVLLNVAIGSLLSFWYGSSDEGVQQLILLNLQAGSPLSAAIESASAAVALLSYPLPLMPVVQLLTSPVEGDTRLADRGCEHKSAPLLAAARSPLERARRRATASWWPQGEDAIRLALLAFTTTVSLLVPNFGAVTGFLGCVNLANSALLPPLIHLRLVALERQSCTWGYRRGVVVDVLLILLGAATLMFFTALSGRALLLGGGR